MAKDLAKWAKEKGVKYFMISYTDLFGGQRAKLVPTQAINDMAVDGAGFAGFATWLDLTPAHPDLMAVPDPDSGDPAAVEEGRGLGRGAGDDGGKAGRSGPAQRAGEADRRSSEGRPARQDRGGAGVLHPERRWRPVLRTSTIPPKSPATTSRR